MKNIEKVIDNHIKNIERNNLTVIEYGSSELICKCNGCGYIIKDNYRNLSYKKFKCRYCTLISKSILIKNGEVKIESIDGSYINLICKNGHKYKQDRRNLLAGKKCKECYLNNKIIPKDSVIKKFKEIHGEYYQYKFGEFKNIHSHVNITCPKGHEFLTKNIKPLTR